MAAEDHLSGQQFSMENNTLHVEGKPFRMAQHLDSLSHEDWHAWRIPFESGHELQVGGTFDPKTGQNVSYHNDQSFAPGLHVHSLHAPSGTRNEMTSRDPSKPKVKMTRVTTGDELRDRIKEAGQLSGGGQI